MDYMQRAVSDITSDVLDQMVKTGMYNGATLSELDPDAAQEIGDQVGTAFALGCTDPQHNQVFVQNLLLEKYKAIAAGIAKRHAADLAEVLRLSDEEQERAFMFRRTYGGTGCSL
jgi:hypothetical protein